MVLNLILVHKNFVGIFKFNLTMIFYILDMTHDYQTKQTSKRDKAVITTPSHT